MSLVNRESSALQDAADLIKMLETLMSSCKRGEKNVPWSGMEITLRECKRCIGLALEQEDSKQNGEIQAEETEGIAGISLSEDLLTDRPVALPVGLVRPLVSKAEPLSESKDDAEGESSIVSASARKSISQRIRSIPRVREMKPQV